MNSPGIDPDLSKRALDVAEWGAKFALAITAIVAAFRGVYLPLLKWRETQRARQQEVLGHQVRTILVADLETLDKVAKDSAEAVRLVKLLHADMELFLEVAEDNRDRLDAWDEIMTAMGFASGDQRTGDERRLRLTDIFDTLKDRRKDRRRKVD